MAPRICSMQSVDCMARGLYKYALCYCMLVGMCRVTVKTIFSIFLLYVVRVGQSHISVQTDDNTGHLSAKHAGRDGIFSRTPVWKKKKQTHLRNLLFWKEHVHIGFFLLKYYKFLHINFKGFMTVHRLFHTPSSPQKLMNSLENFCVQFFQRCNTVIIEQS
jgi:hypothetical protein